jgi:hypothetical protein
MKENIKIVLLSIIALTLIYDTFIESAGNENTHNHSPIAEAKTSGNPVDVTAPAPVQVQPQEPAAPKLPATTIQFDKMEHDFGKIKQETENKYLFKFKNTGSEPLVIENAVGSCGCTVPKYPREPIAPGQTGEIEVEYKPGKQQGAQVKTVTLTANTEPAETKLQIKAQVEEIK